MEKIINPKRITKYNRTKRELQIFMLFSLLVRGANAEQQAVKLTKMLKGCPKRMLPFTYVKREGIEKLLREHKTGKYRMIASHFEKVRDKNLKRISLDELERLVGRKTSRLFILHSRRNSRCAVIDTHILKFLQERFPDQNVPKSTPSSDRAYKHWEDKFLRICEEEKIDVAFTDLAIWRHKAYGE